MAIVDILGELSSLLSAEQNPLLLLLCVYGCMHACVRVIPAMFHTAAWHSGPNQFSYLTKQVL